MRLPPPGSLSQNFPEILGQETFYLLSSPSPNFAGNFGAGNIWRLFAAFFAQKFPGNFGVGDAASRDYTKRQISRKFWDGPSQFFQEILERFFFIISRQISRKFRSYENFRKFWDGRRSTLSSLPAQIFLEILGQEAFGNYLLCFALRNSPGIWGRETLLREITRNVKFQGNFGTAHSKFSRKFWKDFFKLSRVKFLGNFVHTKFSDRFGTGALGLYSEILRKFWGPTFPGNFWGRKHLATVRCVFCSKILREFWHEKRFCARLHEISNF